MKPMVILTGPTAVGKTELSIRLAKILDAEIISADSMQVYKKMDIGTAKIMPEEMEGIKHYLVDELDPKEEFHVARFQQMAKDALKEIYAKGKMILISQKKMETRNTENNWKKKLKEKETTVYTRC